MWTNPWGDVLTGMVTIFLVLIAMAVLLNLAHWVLSMPFGARTKGAPDTDV